MRRKNGEDISLLGTLFVQEYIGTIRFCIRVMCFTTQLTTFFRFVFMIFFVFNSSLDTVQ